MLRSITIALAVASLAAQAVGQRADVSIYDRATGRALPVYWHEGRAYVVGRPGNEYQVTVKNRLGEDVKTDIEATVTDITREKGVSNSGANVSWVYWIPSSGDWWLSFSTAWTTGLLSRREMLRRSGWTWRAVVAHAAT